MTNLALIDPFSSPAYLAETLNQYDVKLCVVYTPQHISESEQKRRFRSDLFEDILYTQGTAPEDVTQIAEALKSRNVEYVLCGSESSVAFTDKLAQLVCPRYSNDPASADRRSDKYAMQEALRKANIPCVNQLKVQSGSELTSEQVETLQAWGFPVFVKPANGTASIGVKKCADLEELQHFLGEAPQTLFDGSTVHELIIQELLTGVEYIVDTVSLEGKHVVVGVGFYHKEFYQGLPIYRSVAVADPQSPEWNILTDYVLKVLEAIELHNGFAHTELFLTEKGPRLVEVNPRISGLFGFHNKACSIAFHSSQPQALWQLITQQAHPSIEKLHCHAESFLLQNWQPRQIGEVNTALLKSLASYKEHFVLKSAGSFLQEPHHLLDTVAVVLLANSDSNHLQQDIARLKEWEKMQQLF